MYNIRQHDIHTRYSGTHKFNKSQSTSKEEKKNCYVIIIQKKNEEKKTCLYDFHFKFHIHLLILFINCVYLALVDDSDTKCHTIFFFTFILFIYLLF